MIAIGLSYFLKISLREWFAILLSICFVFVCELFNTALENVCDMISKEEHLAIKKAKDQAAAAVLIASVFALIIGAFFFFFFFAKDLGLCGRWLKVYVFGSLKSL
ncbi:MAG: diacylglycerol kinase family protein [Saprospiraceae bacterium]|nr:diacylglycerol kinase family protein [Saprospiraceae bacterium]